MIGTLNAYKLCFVCFKAIIEEVCGDLNADIKYIYRQINVISMELLRKFNVKIVNMSKIHMFIYYNLYRSVVHKHPGSFSNHIKNSYGHHMGRLARG